MMYVSSEYSRGMTCPGFPHESFYGSVNVIQSSRKAVLLDVCILYPSLVFRWSDAAKSLVTTPRCHFCDRRSAAGVHAKPSRPSEPLTTPAGAQGMCT